VDTDGVLEMGGVTVRLADGETFDLSPRSNTKTTQGSWLNIAPTAVYQGDHESQSAVLYTGGASTVTALPLGGFEEDVQVRVTTAGVVPGTSPATFTAEYSLDGVNWTEVTVDNSTTTPVISTPYGGVQVSATAGNLDGLAFTVQAGSTGVVQMGAEVNAEGRGLFGGDVMVRIDEAATIGSGTAFSYSYSTDGGVNWSEGHTTPNPAGGPAELLVPGGKLVLSERTGTTDLAEGAQFVIHPQTASHEIEISAGEYIQVNNIGSEIFGGFYEYGTQPVFGETAGENNIFVAVGRLVAALENNDQQGCADALESLKTSQEYFTTQLASVGARENRLDVADTVLSSLQLNETERMSNIEDVDLATLLTDLANQQLSYETVLKSSSMIMKMSLVNYL
jgi:flagellar hook-associated protein 3 FlgL